LGFDMWATIVNRDGEVCLVVHSGAASDHQWPGSRVISAQKANTANAFSLDGLALSTANLFTAVQPGGSLFGLQESNPVDTAVAYGNDATTHGDDTGPATPSTDYGAGSADPMVGHIIGGVNVFGGGLGLYDQNQQVIGGLGISGDTSCTDHIVAWKLRDALGLDNVPGGVSPTGDDNIIHDITNPPSQHRHTVSASGFGHPTCINLPGTGNAEEIAQDLPTTDPIGPNP
jgi:uncharacterized protein GlcG (DUF336 family)